MKLKIHFREKQISFLDHTIKLDYNEYDYDFLIDLLEKFNKKIDSDNINDLGDFSEECYDFRINIEYMDHQEQLFLEIKNLIISKSNIEKTRMNPKNICADCGKIIECLDTHCCILPRPKKKVLKVKETESKPIPISSIIKKEDELLNLVKELTNNFTQIIPRELTREYPKLDWGDNGIGDRWCNKKFNYSSIYSKHKVKLNSENEYDLVPQELLDEFFKTQRKGQGIKGIFVHSLRENKIERPICSKISKIIKSRRCVSCGSSSKIVCDHKNDLYNDPRVLSLETQRLDDFQPLCEHCNLQKRQVCKEEKKNSKLYSAKNLEIYKIYPFDFPWEKKSFNEKDITTKLDTYWYDPIEFQSKLYYYSFYKKLVVDVIKTKKVKDI